MIVGAKIFVVINTRQISVDRTCHIFISPAKGIFGHRNSYIFPKFSIKKARPFKLLKYGFNKYLLVTARSKISYFNLDLTMPLLYNSLHRNFLSSKSMANKSIKVFGKTTSIENVKNPDKLPIPFPKSIWGPRASNNFVYSRLEFKINIISI